MATAPSLRGIPFYSGTATDSSGFAPVYDPRAIRFARKVNFAIGTVIGLAALGLTALLLSTPALSSTADSESAIVRVIFNFALPLSLVAVGFLLIVFLTPRIGFDLPRAYSATADALRNWLPTAAGDYPEPKEDPIEELKETFATPADSIRFLLDADAETSIHQAAKEISRQSPESVHLLSKDMRHGELRLAADGRYGLTIG